MNHVTNLRKKLHDKQHNFSLKVLHQLQNGALLENSICKVDIEAILSLIKERNKFFVSANSFEWVIALCYIEEPLAKDSEDESGADRYI